MPGDLSGNPETSSIIRTYLEMEPLQPFLWLRHSMSLISLLHATDEYILPETMADYVNVPQFFQLPTSPPRSSDSGIYSPLTTSMMDEREWGNIKTCVVRVNL